MQGLVSLSGRVHFPISSDVTLLSTTVSACLSDPLLCFSLVISWRCSHKHFCGCIFSLCFFHIVFFCAFRTNTHHSHHGHGYHTLPSYPSSFSSNSVVASNSVGHLSCQSSSLHPNSAQDDRATEFLGTDNRFGSTIPTTDIAMTVTTSSGSSLSKEGEAIHYLPKRPIVSHSPLGSCSSPSISTTSAPAYSILTSASEKVKEKHAPATEGTPVKQSAMTFHPRSSRSATVTPNASSPLSLFPLPLYLPPAPSNLSSISSPSPSPVAGPVRTLPHRPTDAAESIKSPRSSRGSGTPTPGGASELSPPSGGKATISPRLPRLPHFHQSEDIIVKNRRSLPKTPEPEGNGSKDELSNGSTTPSTSTSTGSSDKRESFTPREKLSGRAASNHQSDKLKDTPTKKKSFSSEESSRAGSSILPHPTPSTSTDHPPPPTSSLLTSPRSSPLHTNRRLPSPRATNTSSLSSSSGNISTPSSPTARQLPGSASHLSAHSGGSSSPLHSPPASSPSSGSRVRSKTSSMPFDNSISHIPHRDTT
eukprot:TRINITY_DN8010_c0_g1_i2.p1 TRINITY_DN8010_c0_g1~~TRINITY_DN8010_c0_g1_i2.p1  ORF type:complete len:534 (+),score=126.92 TRINITY_DN8010_c0_g1_i2:2059-3660(+)